MPWESYRSASAVGSAVSPTVHELRNAIRTAVGRFERETNASFTKEDLAAIADALGRPVGGKPFPPTAEMRAEIRGAVGLGDGGGTFDKSELESIAEALDAAAA